MQITTRRKGAPFSRPLEQMYSITEASREVGVARQTMSRWIKEGRIGPVSRMSRTVVRVPASSVNRYLKRSGRAVQVMAVAKAQTARKKSNFSRAAKKRGFGTAQRREYFPMKNKRKKSRPEASAPEINIPIEALIDEALINGVVEPALLDAAHGTAQAFKLKEAEQQMAQGEPVPVTIFLVNDRTGLQTIIEGCPEEGTFCAFSESLHTAIARVAPLRSTFGFHIKGAKHLLSATDEALIFWSASYSGLSVSVAVPILRSPTGNFLTFGEEFDIQWDLKLLHHAFGEEEADSSLPSQDQFGGNLWGNN